MNRFPAFIGLLAMLLSTRPFAPALAADDPTPKSLQPTRFQPLPLGAIKPAGWLKTQLELQAQGLSGHLDEFWPDIQDSAWIGGKAEGWERVPYWLDGLVPLAWQLDDPRLQAKCKKYIDYILEHQHPDGWLGPIGDTQKHRPYDVWPLFPLLKALTQYQEAAGDPRVIPALLKVCRKIDQVISAEPMYSWAKMRAADLVVTLYWLHDRTGGKEPWLLDLARKAFDQSHDWRAQWLPFKFTGKTQGKFELDTHGVNTGMALKYGPIRYRLSNDPRDLEILDAALHGLDSHHGQATGIFTCDEHLAGRSPSQGTELCTVVEAMYSLEIAGAVAGKVAYFDRLERLAYNALPATFKKDMTAHQYDQQTNQVQCVRSGEHPWVNNGPDANLFGLEPNFGCCTANLHQGWPKLASHLVMRADQEKGLAVAAYAPCRVQTTIQGKPVTIEIKTDYPFRDLVEIAVTAPQPVEFALVLRQPHWSQTLTLSGNDDRPAQNPSGGKPPGAVIGEWMTVAATPGEFIQHAASWEGTRRIKLQFSNRAAAFRGINHSVAILRGPLVFALPIDAAWKTLVDRPNLPLDDYEVLPQSPWNYALLLDPDDPAKALSFEERPMPGQGSPFQQQAPPFVARIQSRRLPAWGMEQGAAALPPPSPVASSEAIETITLIPYGATDLRITEFPWQKP
jgi:hypothetical protein